MKRTVNVKCVGCGSNFDVVKSLESDEYFVIENYGGYHEVGWEEKIIIDEETDWIDYSEIEYLNLDKISDDIKELFED